MSPKKQIFLSFIVILLYSDKSAKTLLFLCFKFANNHYPGLFLVRSLKADSPKSKSWLPGTANDI